MNRSAVHDWEREEQPVDRVRFSVSLQGAITDEVAISETLIQFGFGHRVIRCALIGRG